VNASFRRTASLRFACPAPPALHTGERRVLEVRHEDVRAGIERIDHHLALDRTGDLDVPFLQIGGCRSDLPVARPDLGRLRQELEGAARSELSITFRPLLQKLLPPGVEGAMQLLQEGERGLRTRFPGTRWR